MWIERIEFTGFGNLVNQKIEFSKDKLNLVLEANEYGKSTIGEAIWAVLFDYPRSKNTSEKLKDREARQPAAGTPFKACLDITSKEMQLRVVRDFGNRTLKVFDRKKGDKDITVEFMSGSANDELGQRLTGMSRELFRNTFFVAQRDLDRNALGETDDLSSLLQSLADSSGSATTSATAISVIERSLSHFPYQGIRIRVDKLLQQLEEERDRTQELMESLREEYESAAGEMSRLAAIEEKLNSHEMQTKSAQYFELCMEAAEVDSRLLKAQEKVLRVNDLKTQLSKLTEFKEFPAERSRSVEELWTKRESRQSDHKRTDLELRLKDKQLQARDLEVRERWEGVSKCTVEDAQALSSLARTLSEVRSELGDSKRKQEEEVRRVKEAGIELDKLAGTRTALLSLDARDLDNANVYHAMIGSSRDQIKECEGLVWRARQILPEINEQRKIKVASCRNNFVLLGMLSLLFLGIEAFLIFVGHQPMNHPLVLVGFAILAGVAIGIAVNIGMWGQARAFRENEAAQAREDESKQAEKGTELLNKIMGLEIKLDDLARKAGVTDGADLVKHIQAYGTTAAQLKDLDLLDQVIDSRETHVVKLIGQMEPYFTKADRKVPEVNSEAAFKLADDINRYLEESRAVQSSSGSIEHHQSELKFLSDELKDIDSKLKEHFDLSGVEHADDPELGYKEFNQKLAGFKQWESLQIELSRMEQDTTTDLPASELPSVIQRLEAQRQSLWSRIEQLIAAHPDIAQQAPPALSELGAGQDEAGESAAVVPEELRRTREDLMVQLRTTTRNYDEKYLSTAEEYEGLEADIAKVRRAKTALELARDTFRRLAEETHGNWSSRLNEISREMLESLATDFESLHFDPDLRLTARRKGESEPLQQANINSQTSGGTREQLHWLARMAVARYLAEQAALPVILDEPFSESDDERFLATMQFLLDTMLGKHQLILFSCHQRRHEWLQEQLSETQLPLIKQCRLEPMAVMSDATS